MVIVFKEAEAVVGAAFSASGTVTCVGFRVKNAPEAAHSDFPVGPVSLMPVLRSRAIVSEK